MARFKPMASYLTKINEDETIYIRTDYDATSLKYNADGSLSMESNLEYYVVKNPSRTYSLLPNEMLIIFNNEETKAFVIVYHINNAVTRISFGEKIVKTLKNINIPIVPFVNDYLDNYFLSAGFSFDESIYFGEDNCQVINFCDYVNKGTNPEKPDPSSPEKTNNESYENE